MANEYTGNATPVPSYSKNGSVSDPEILKSTAPGSYLEKGVTVLGGQGVLPAGTVVGQVTASKKYKVYKSNASDGSQNPVGVLRRACDTGSGATAKDVQNNILLRGVLDNSLVSGGDANAITALNARVDASNGLFIF